MDAQVLLKAIMPRTRQGLEAGESFAPMGAALHVDESIEQVDSDWEASLPMSEKVELVRGEVRRVVASGGVRSAAVAADVMMWRRENGEEASPAVSVHMEHQSGYCVDLLIPYKVRRGMLSRLRKKPHIMFRAMIAQQSDPVFFRSLQRRD